MAAKLANCVRQIIGPDRIEATGSEAVAQMMLDRVAVARPCRRPEVNHRPSEPLIGRVAQPQATVVHDPFATRTLREEPVSHSASRLDAPIDGPPPLLAADVLEADLVDTGRATINVALDPDAPRRLLVLGHGRRLSDATQRVRQMPRPSPAPPPGVEIRAPEIQLAVRSVLLRQDRSFGGKLPQSVPVDTEVLGRVP